MEVYPKAITKQCHQEILNQINNSICKIIQNNQKIEIGCFCIIKKENKDIPVIIINNYINDDYYNNKINIIINNENKVIEINKIIYKNEEENISIIKIKDDKNYNFIKYVEIDDKIYENQSEEDSEMYYNKETISEGGHMSVKESLKEETI